MTDEIEREALVLLNAVRAECKLGPAFLMVNESACGRALCRAVEQLHAERAAHEATKAREAAFRQEVSEAVFDYFQDDTTENSNRLCRFIIPSPDPITEWLHASGYEGNAAVEQAVRAYAKERGEHSENDDAERNRSHDQD